MESRLQSWLLSIRDSFVSLLPLTLFGVAAVLLKHVPLALSAWSFPGALVNAGWFGHFLDNIIQASHGVFGLALSVTISLHLSARLPKLSSTDDNPPPIIVAVFALVGFMLCYLSFSASRNSMGYDVMLMGIAVGIVSIELLRWAAGRRWLMFVNPPPDADIALAHSLRFCLPLIFCGGVIFLFAKALSSLDVHRQAFAALAEWLRVSVLGDFISTSVAVLLNHISWFIGVHGGHILDTYANDIFVPKGLPPDGQLAWRPLLDSFVLLGGTGTTLGLVLAILIVAPEGAQRRIAKLGLLPSLFNINEVVLFGLPIVMSPIYLLPFIVVPVILGLLTLAAVHADILIVHPENVPWTTPPLLSGWLLTGSWRGAAWQFLEILLSAFMYLPFVRKAEAIRSQRRAQLHKQVIDALMRDESAPAIIIRRRDEIGMTSRLMLAALRADIKRGSLTLAYQPKHNRDGKLMGLEALVRWKSEIFGQVPAGAAVKLAEEGACIRELGYWVIEEACASKARWNALGYAALTVAINVSPSQLSDENFTSYLALALRRHDLGIHEIEIEITESQAIQEEEKTNATLKALSASGIRLSMDDFGMGHSSLLHLRRFRIHSIKIDGSLTREVLNSATNADIIRAIVSLGKARHIEVIAEFVETDEQRQALMEIGCDVFQGYYYSPPLTEGECLKYIAKAGTGRAIEEEADGYLERPRFALPGKS